MTLLHQDLSHQETFEKFSGTAITCADHRFLKLHLGMDSRLSGNDASFARYHDRETVYLQDNEY